MLPEYLKKEGYKSHLFGKWHLGFCSENYTPIKRGFDTFHGLYVSLKKYEELRTNQNTDHMTREQLIKHVEKTTYHKIKAKHKTSLLGQTNGQPRNSAGIYNRLVWGRLVNIINDIKLKKTKRPPVITSEHYLAKVEDALSKHDDSSPFFFYLSLFTKFYNKYKEENIIKDRPKILKNMDDTVGKVVDLLKQSGHYNNTIILFISDNGGRKMPEGVPSPNYPLRGYKGSIYEGGTKVPAFIHSPLFNQRGYRCVL